MTRQNKLDGHDVKIVASTEIFKNGKLDYTIDGSYENEYGIEVTRIPYRKFLPFKVMRKLRFYKGLFPILSSFKPDIIFFHGTTAGELLTITKYMKKNKNVKLYIDSHEAFHNTAKTFLSKCIYKYIHGYFMKKVLPYTNKVLYIEEASKEYLETMYHIKGNKLEWYPLGGIVFGDEVYNEKRKLVRDKLKIKEDEILFVHSGKMDKAKKTKNILKAFGKVTTEKFKLILIGNFPEDVWMDVKSYIEADNRISFIGWKSGDELLNYLCAADIYLQPGSCSATLQNAICCRCGVVLYPHIGYRAYREYKNGFFVKNEKDLQKVLEEIHQNPLMVKELQANSEKAGRNVFDYRKLASRIYE